MTELAERPRVEVTEPTPPLDRVRLDLVDSVEKAGEFMRWLDQRRTVLGVDTETAGLVPWRDRLRLVQFGDTMTGWAVPWGGWGGVAKEALSKYQGEIVFHNSKFDVNFLLLHGAWPRIPWERIHDTLTQAHLDDPTRTRALKKLGGLLIDQRAAAAQTTLDVAYNRNNWTWATIPIERTGEASPYWIYGALDPVLTARLHELFTPIRARYRVPYELEMGTLISIAAMERRGARVDLEYSRRMVGVIDEFSWSSRKWILDNYGVKNATSSPQCIAKFEELGRRITRKTKSGGKSLDKDQLEMFLIGADHDGYENFTQQDVDALPGNDLARAILALRRGEKFVGPYFKNFNELSDSNGYVHPTIWPVGTRTARMSIQHPALQTLPRKDPTVRDAFIPSEGRSLLMFDYDQIEMRLAAHFSQDAGMRAAFLAPGDFFTEIGKIAFNEPGFTREDPRRQLMKNGLYGSLYGASNPKIAVTAGVPVTEIDYVMATFHERYPGIRQLQAEIERVGKQRASQGTPFVNTPTGRRMPGDRDKVYVLTNYLIQSHAAEVLKRAIVELEQAGLGEYMILPVHDELVFDVPNEHVDDAFIAIGKIMEDRTNYFVPLTAEGEIARGRWGDKYRKKPKEVTQ